MITKDEFIQAFEANDSTDWKGDNAFQGLQIIAKYINPAEKDLICGAGHDQIHSVRLDDICKAGITIEDVKALRKLNWSIEDGEWLSCFV